MKKTTFQWGIALLGVALLTGFDQWTKHLAAVILKGTDSIVWIPGVFELRYLENQGAAFGILQQKQTFFIVLTLTAIALILWLFLFRIPSSHRFFALNLVCVLLVSGAVGNLIDRVRQAYVVDFFYFRLIDFPIFNVADCYVTISAVLLIWLILFVYSEEELGSILGG